MVLAELAGFFLLLTVIFFFGAIYTKDGVLALIAVIFFVISSTFQRFYVENDYLLEKHYNDKRKKEKIKQKYFEKYGEKY